MVKALSLPIIFANYPSNRLDKSSICAIICTLNGDVAQLVRAHDS